MQEQDNSRPGGGAQDLDDLIYGSYSTPSISDR